MIGVAAASQPARVQGMDALRFVCALVVLMGHFAPPLPDSLGPDATGLFRVARGLISCLFNGPAAVVVFFVISGFCIHFPQRDHQRLQVVPFFCRRMLRIGIPAVVSIVFTFMVGMHLQPPYFGVLWSIICELVYYLLYPVLLLLRRRCGWSVMIAVSSALTVLLWATHVQEMLEAKHSYPAFGYMTWVNGLPCWLLGCWLAENLAEVPHVSLVRVWAWRCLVIGVSIVLRIAKFHVASVLASNCITLNLFAFLVCFWLREEIACHQARPASAVLEWGGQWSYSLYLMHVLAPVMTGLFIPASQFASYPGWGCLIIVSLALSYVFFLLVEAPSQKLAKALSAKLKLCKGPEV